MDYNFDHQMSLSKRLNVGIKAVVYNFGKVLLHFTVFSKNFLDASLSVLTKFCFIYFI